MFPCETWCGISCIRDKKDCFFLENCGYRSAFGRFIKRRHSQSGIRYGKVNEKRTYIKKSDLFDLLRVYLMTGFVCWYCGEKMEVCIGQSQSNACTIDHRIPLSKGGTNHISNIVFCCLDCNQEKADNMHPGDIPVSHPDLVAFMNRMGWS